MNNQEISAEAFKLGWDKCRAWICKHYNLDENDVIAKEMSEDLIRMEKDK